MTSPTRTIFKVKNEYWEFSEPTVSKIYFKNFFKNLLNSEISKVNSKSYLQKRLESWRPGNSKNGEFKVYSLFYEYGLLLNGLEVSENTPLGLEFVFTKKSVLTEEDLLKILERSSDINFELCSSPKYDFYKSRFNEIQNELILGNTYQVNFTQPYQYKYTSDAENLVLKNLLLSTGAYSHAIFCPTLEKVFLTQTPECLFQWGEIDGDYKIESMPIKGTISDTKSPRLLTSSVKDQAELYMIIDLIRNDLNRLESPNAKVVKKKALLKVKGLWHQFAHIEKNVSKKVSLDEILKSLFPGGSVTGAPKLRTMEIIKRLEERERGFYCGSTLFEIEDCIKASINIRSAVFNTTKKSFTYQAGGGITLLSECDLEFDEMNSKVASFVDNF